MTHTRSASPSDYDPDQTDRLPVLDPGQEQDDELATTGSWSTEEMTRALPRLHDADDEARDEAVTQLTSALREKSFAIARLQRDLDQARAELGRLARGPAPEVADLEQRLQRVERERLDLAAQHDERRTALAALEDQLSEAREGQQQIEEEAARLRDQLASAVRERDESRELLAVAQDEIARLARAATNEAREQELQRLKSRINELRNALEVAHEELAATAKERDELRLRVESRVMEFVELKEELDRRGTRIESLLERVRTHEARRRYASDFRQAEPAEARSSGLAARVAELERALVAEREVRQAAEARLQGAEEADPGDQDTDEPTVTEADRETLLSRLTTLAAEVSRRDDRIATLESELRVQSTAIATIRDGSGLVSDDAGRSSEEVGVAPRYLTRIDEGAGAVHVLARPQVTIGRTPDNDVQVREKYISRHHATIRIGPEAAIIEDAGSSNGVFVNERRIRRDFLRDGDIVALGKARYRFELIRPGSGDD